MDADTPDGRAAVPGFDAGRLDELGAWMADEVVSGKLPSAEALIWRGGREVYRRRAGRLDIDRVEPLPADAIFRIYSMTKPVTNVAVMMLWQEGAFDLDDPVARFLPAFDELRVLAGGTADAPVFESVRTRLTIRHLLTHTGGLVYGGRDDGPVGAAYRAAGVDFSLPTETLAKVVERLASMPLLFQPGSRWTYSCAHDLLGHLVEVWSGDSLDAFFRRRIFAPLGMADTGFHLPAGAEGRFVSNYRYDAEGRLNCKNHECTERYAHGGTLFSGGGGLVSTMDDYLRFARMLLGRGSLDGVTVLKSETMELMTRNHLPDDKGLPAMGQADHSGVAMDGIGYGLGWSVTIDAGRACAAGTMTTAGDFGWGGAASTYFWVAPEHHMIALFMSQLMPSAARPTRRRFRELVHRALVG